MRAIWIVKESVKQQWALTSIWASAWIWCSGFSIPDPYHFFHAVLEPDKQRNPHNVTKPIKIKVRFSSKHGCQILRMVLSRVAKTDTCLEVLSHARAMKRIWNQNGFWVLYHKNVRTFVVHGEWYCNNIVFLPEAEWSFNLMQEEILTVSSMNAEMFALLYYSKMVSYFCRKARKCICRTLIWRVTDLTRQTCL